MLLLHGDDVLGLQGLWLGGDVTGEGHVQVADRGLGGLAATDLEIKIVFISTTMQK